MWNVFIVGEFIEQDTYRDFQSETHHDELSKSCSPSRELKCKDSRKMANGLKTD